MFAELRELLRSGAIRRHQLGVKSAATAAKAKLLGGFIACRK